MKESVSQRKYRENKNDPSWLAAEVERLKALAQQDFRPPESLNGMRISIRFYQRRLLTLLSKPSVDDQDKNV